MVERAASILKSAFQIPGVSYATHKQAERLASQPFAFFTLSGDIPCVHDLIKDRGNDGEPLGKNVSGLQSIKHNLLHLRRK
ncbi:hypothetical protein FA04_28185 (plasmid) [Ensifer adhaerens]|nr:hypothetical protein FA04_28185 [Ensifer adhaerens]KQZ49062.1 hypothetical protein ASD63_30945 [Ensifer sp. Root558]